MGYFEWEPYRSILSVHCPPRYLEQIRMNVWLGMGPCPWYWIALAWEVSPVILSKISASEMPIFALIRSEVQSWGKT